MPLSQPTKFLGCEATIATDKVLGCDATIATDKVIGCDATATDKILVAMPLSQPSQLGNYLGGESSERSNVYRYYTTKNSPINPYLHRYQAAIYRQVRTVGTPVVVGRTFCQRTRRPSYEDVAAREKRRKLPAPTATMMGSLAVVDVDKIPICALIIFSKELVEEPSGLVQDARHPRAGRYRGLWIQSGKWLQRVTPESRFLNTVTLHVHKCSYINNSTVSNHGLKAVSSIASSG
jgi:hypothetical protein